jgi:hypothetical protein
MVLALFVAGCENSEVVRTREEDQRVQRLQSDANKVVGMIQYIKDLRTGLCFAYFWGGVDNGGPALATVPCEAIPPKLLTVAK